MTDTEQGFINDIIENPDDDVPRLIYADWLEEHGREKRAEYIRQGIMNAGECLSAIDTAEFVRQFYPTLLMTGKLFPSLGDSGLVPLGSIIANTVHVHRGFITEIHAPLNALLRFLPGLVKQHPIVKVWATDKTPGRRISFDRFYWHICPSGCVGAYVIKYSLRLCKGQPDDFDSEQEAHDWLSGQILAKAKGDAK